MILSISITLLSIGTLIIIGDWVNAYLSTKREGGYTFVPFFAGIHLFIGMMLLPVELPIPKLLAATLAMFLDHTISFGIPWLLYMWYRGDFKK